MASVCSHLYLCPFLGPLFLGPPLLAFPLAPFLKERRYVFVSGNLCFRLFIRSITGLTGPHRVLLNLTTLRHPSSISVNRQSVSNAGLSSPACFRLEIQLSRWRKTRSANQAMDLLEKRRTKRVRIGRILPTATFVRVCVSSDFLLTPI